MTATDEIERNVQRVVNQLNEAVGNIAGGGDLVGAIGELLRVVLKHDARIGELESRIRQLEQNRPQ